VYNKNAAGNFELEARIPTATASRTSLFVPELRKLFLISPGSRDNTKGVIRVYESEGGAGQRASTTEPVVQPPPLH
jgi:hypothetical protein